MMTRGRNPALRLLAIARRRKLAIALATLLGTGVAAVAGLMTPDFYRSEAVVEITDDAKPTTIFDLTDNTGIKLNKAKILMLSPLILEGVAKTLYERLDLDLDAAFPGRYRIYDIKPRLALLEERLFGRKRPSATIKIRMRGVEAITTLISYHLLVNTELDSGSIRVRYEAAEPAIAQEICRLIIERFVEVMNEKDQRELRAKVKYLADTIDDQVKQMRAVAQQRQQLLEENPELGGNGGVGLLQQYLAKKTEIERVRIERELDLKLLESYKELRGKRNRVSDALSKEVRKRLMEELSATELKLAELTKLSGYQSTHGDLVRLRKRSAALRLMLDDAEKQASKDGFGPSLDSEALSGEIQRLTQLVRRSEVQGKLLQDALSETDASRKAAIRVEFELEALERRLATHDTLVKDLQTDLEKARIALAGMNKETTVTMPPSLPVIPISLSLPRRIVFGVFVSLIFAVSVLFGLDLLQPRILGERDFLELGVMALGKDDAVGRGTRRIAGSLLGLCQSGDEGGDGASRRVQGADRRRGHAVLFSAESPWESAVAFVHRLAAEMRVASKRVVVLTFEEGAEMFEPPCDAHMEFGVTFISLRFPENGFAFMHLIERVRAGVDVVLLLVSDLHRLHDRGTILTHADVLVHVATEGATSLEAIVEVQATEGGRAAVKETAILLSA